MARRYPVDRLCCWPPDFFLNPELLTQKLRYSARCARLSAHSTGEREKLKGNLAGLHSIRVNQQWRLIFRWDGERGEAAGIYLDDHSYR